MPTQKKIDSVKNLADKLDRANLVVLADYQGLSVTKLNELRNKIKEKAGNFEVAKNTLLNLAAKNAKVVLPPEVTKGPTAILFGTGANTTPLKAMLDFAKETDSPKIKFGLWEKQPLTIEKIKQLANLPPLDQLYAQLVGRLQGPIYSLVWDLKNNIMRLANVLARAGGPEFSSTPLLSHSSTLSRKVVN